MAAGLTNGIDCGCSSLARLATHPLRARESSNAKRVNIERRIDEYKGQSERFRTAQELSCARAIFGLMSPAVARESTARGLARLGEKSSKIVAAKSLRQISARRARRKQAGEQRNERKQNR